MLSARFVFIRFVFHRLFFSIPLVVVFFFHFVQSTRWWTQKTLPITYDTGKRDEVSRGNGKRWDATRSESTAKTLNKEGITLATLGSALYMCQSDRETLQSRPLCCCCRPRLSFENRKRGLCGPSLPSLWLGCGETSEQFWKCRSRREAAGPSKTSLVLSSREPGGTL